MGLTEKEKEIIYKFADAWNLFNELDSIHCMEKDEMCRAIHDCQYLIARRVAQRVNPEIWGENK